MGIVYDRRSAFVGGVAGLWLVAVTLLVSSLHGGPLPSFTAVVTGRFPPGALVALLGLCSGVITGAISRKVRGDLATGGIAFLVAFVPFLVVTPFLAAQTMGTVDGVWAYLFTLLISSPPGAFLAATGSWFGVRLSRTLVTPEPDPL